MSFRNKLAAVFGTALAILLGIGIFSYLRIQHDRADQDWVEHTHSSLEILDAYQSDLAGAATDVRGYVNSGDTTYLQEYHDSVARIGQDSAALADLTRDNPVQQRALAKLAPVTAVRIHTYDQRIATFDAKTPRSPAAAGAAAITLENAELVQTLFAGMKAEEQRLLKQRLETAGNGRLELRLVIIFGNVLALFFLIAAAMVVHSEMSKRQDAEETLRRNDERIRLLISGVKDYAILMLDQQGYVTSWNSGAERITGYRAEEMLGQHFSRFYPAEAIQQDKPWQELNIATEQGSCEDEGWRVRKDGSRFWANVITTALRDSSGRLRGFAKVTRDMTERKKTEKELELRNAQLEAANKELEQFSYSVSHDLRAPLRGIDGFSQALLEDCSGQLDEQGKAHLQHVRAAAQQMALLIDDLLGLARITRTELQRKPIDLSALAQSVANDLRVTNPSRRLELVIAPNLEAEGDVRLLRTVIENLLGNSWKFTSKKSDARIEVGSTEMDGEQVFFIRDNGAGFDPDHTTQLFGAFQRLHLTSEFPGTGIGLASVQRIVNRHGGRIWAEGRVEQGATFYFTLLASHATEEATHAL